jgi:hypothetical protein
MESKMSLLNEELIFPKFNSVSLQCLKPIISILYSIRKEIPEFADAAICKNRWIYFVGEWLPSLKQWFPFGLIVEKETAETTDTESRATSYMLSLKHRDLFAKAGLPLPELKYQGPLYQGIIELNDFLLSNVSEGIVITLNPFSCVKYKSPLYENQLKLKLDRDMVALPPEANDIHLAFQLVIDMLTESFRIRAEKNESKAKAKAAAAATKEEKKPNPIANLFKSASTLADLKEILHHLETHMPIQKANAEMIVSAVLDELLQMHRIEKSTLNESTQKKLLGVITTTVEKSLL